MALFWFLAFVSIATTATWLRSPKLTGAKVTLLLWALLLTPLALAYPVFEPFVSKSLWEEPETRIRGDEVMVHDSVENISDVKIWKLFRLACLENFQPSESWSNSFEDFLKRDGAWWAVHRFVKSEPKFQVAINHHLKRKYGLDGEIDAELALETLERLGQEDIDVKTWLRVENVVKILRLMLTAQT